MRRLIVLIAVASSCSADPTPEAGPDGPTTSESITVTLVQPDGWPNPIYPDAPETTIEHGWEARFPTTGERTDIVLPRAGEYRVGAITGDGGCFDTAGVGMAGNPAIDLQDGDTVRLIDTGEICD